MVEGLEAVEEVANWIRKNGCNSHRSFWRRFRFSFRAYSFLQQLRLMRRKRCSRPSLKESTSGRCNYDLACYFSFLFPTSIFPPPSSFRFSSSLLPFLTPPTREGDERLFNENGEMSFRAWQWNSRQNLVVVWRSFSFYSRARFLSTSTIFGDEFLPRFRIFKKSSLDLDISNTYRPFKSYRRFNIFRVVFELGFRWGGIWRVITVETLENGEPSWVSGPCTGALEGLVLSFDPC